MRLPIGHPSIDRSCGRGLSGQSVRPSARRKMKRSRVMRCSSGSNLIISRESDSCRASSFFPYFISCQCEIYDSIGQNLLFCQPPANSAPSEMERILKCAGEARCTLMWSKMGAFRYVSSLQEQVKRRQYIYWRSFGWIQSKKNINQPRVSFETGSLLSAVFLRRKKYFTFHIRRSPEGQPRHMQCKTAT